MPRLRPAIRWVFSLRRSWLPRREANAHQILIWDDFHNVFQHTDLRASRIVLEAICFGRTRDSGYLLEVDGTHDLEEGTNAADHAKRSLEIVDLPLQPAVEDNGSTM